MEGSMEGLIEESLEGDALALALERIGGKWSLQILAGILAGCATFGGLQRRLPGIPSNLLSARLRELECGGLIESELYTAHPPRYRYLPLDAARELEGTLRELSAWGARRCAEGAAAGG